MYILLRKLSQVVGYKTPYYTIMESEDRHEIVEKMKRLVVAGCPVDDLRVMKDEKFEFKCAVSFKADKTES